MKITVVCEDNASMQEPAGIQAYPDGMWNCLKRLFEGAGHEVAVIVNDKDSNGSAITDEVLDNTDVMVWWGHWYHGNILDEVADKVVYAVQKGMGFMALHSAHHCKPFKRLTGTTCNLSWREIQERERIWIIDDTHPITQGVPTNFVIPHEEMYGEPFDIPNPDQLIMLGWFQGGEVMRSGAVFNRGKGKVFFFQPGHETNPTFHIKHVQTILLNAVEFLKPIIRATELTAPKILPAPEGDITITEWEE